MRNCLNISRFVRARKEDIILIDSTPRFSKKTYLPALSRLDVLEGIHLEKCLATDPLL